MCARARALCAPSLLVARVYSFRNIDFYTIAFILICISRSNCRERENVATLNRDGADTIDCISREINFKLLNLLTEETLRELKFPECFVQALSELSFNSITRAIRILSNKIIAIHVSANVDSIKFSYVRRSQEKRIEILHLLEIPLYIFQRETFSSVLARNRVDVSFVFSLPVRLLHIVSRKAPVSLFSKRLVASFIVPA